MAEYYNIDKLVFQDSSSFTTAVVSGAAGPSGSSTIDVFVTGSEAAAGAFVLDFSGSGGVVPSVIFANGTASIDISGSVGSGGGTNLELQDETVSLTTTGSIIDFQGAGVTATNSGGKTVITIPAGGPAGPTGSTGPTGASGSNTIDIFVTGSEAATDAFVLNFSGSGGIVPSVTFANGTASIDISGTVGSAGGGSNTVDVFITGSEAAPDAFVLNFSGSGGIVPSATISNGTASIDISGSLPRWQRLKTVEITGAVTSSIILDGLDGDTDEEYLIQYDIIHGEAGTTREFSVRPNGLTTNVAGATTINGAAAETRNVVVVSSTLRYYIMGEFMFKATGNPSGSPVSRPRAVIGSAVLSDESASSSGIYTLVHAGAWTPGAVNLTSIEIVSTVDNTNTLTNAIQTGSCATIYRRAR